MDSFGDGHKRVPQNKKNPSTGKFVEGFPAENNIKVRIWRNNLRVMLEWRFSGWSSWSSTLIHL